MKALIPLIAAAGILAGCQSDSQSDRAVGGALLGGTAGAVVGGLATDSVGGAVVGGVVGAAGGAIVGSATTPANCVDSYGNRVPCP
jgi:hypothetical protein